MANSRVYLEVDPRHPPLIQQWVEARVEELRYIQTQHDITGRSVWRENLRINICRLVIV